MECGKEKHLKAIKLSSVRNICNLFDNVVGNPIIIKVVFSPINGPGSVLQQGSIRTKVVDMTPVRVPLISVTSTIFTKVVSIIPVNVELILVFMAFSVEVVNLAINRYKLVFDIAKFRADPFAIKEVISTINRLNRTLN